MSLRRNLCSADPARRAGLFGGCLAWGLTWLAAGCMGHGAGVRQAPAEQQAAVASSLPVKRVVLFQNGVAYLERRGAFRGCELQLSVRPTQIRDILKSITVVDFGGGHASTLALPVDVGSARALAELPRVELGQGALSDILRVLRGAVVRLETDDDEVVGRLVGVDAASSAELGQSIAVLDGAGDLKVFSYGRVRSLRILDPTLADGLVKGLDLSLGQDAWRPVPLKVFLDKNEPGRDRDLLVSYLVEMPTWKSSYRLVLDGEQQPLLQGWAIVDNVSGEDWRDVKLTLTTGSPVSFHYDLYTPRFVDRPDLTPYQTLGLRPPVAQSSQAVALKAPPPPPASQPMPKKSMAGRSRRAPAGEVASRAGLAKMDWAGDSPDESRLADMPAEPELDGEALYGSMQAQASATKVGSLYRFELAEPVTVPNRSSTMIAIINRRVPGRAIYSFNPETGIPEAQRHPFRAVAIQNQTDAVLEPGPMSIMRNGQFVGEGLIERIEKGQHSYLAYALDTAVDVTHNTTGSVENAGVVRIARGVVETKTFSIQRHEFEARATAEDGEALPLMVALPKRAGWEVEVEGGQPESETAEVRYFSMPVRPGESSKLTVKEKIAQRASYRIIDPQAQQALLLYIESSQARPELVARLKPVIDKVRALSDLRVRMSTLEQQRSDLQQRAGEIRENLRLLRKSRNAKLKAEQTARLSEVDTKLNRLTDSLVELRDQAAQLSVELNTLVEQLEIVF